MPRAPPHVFSSLAVQRSGSIPYTCASCILIRAIARVSLRQRVIHLQNQRRRQYASTFASPATVNKAVDVPESSRELYNALEGLKRDAAGFTNLSRVQLALKSLEERAGIRVAILGLGADGLAKRLVKLLLADPLGSQGEWERKVGGEAVEDGTSLLLRFGEDTDIPASNSLLRTIHAPAKILESNNLEVLVATLRLAPSPVGSPADSGGGAQDAVLVPTLETPTSSSGRFSQVTYPVHKTILLGDGIDSLIAYGRFTAALGTEKLPSDTVKLVVNVPGSQSEAQQSDQTAIIDLNLAEKSLDLFRESLSNALPYEQGWFKAGMPGLSDWLVSGTTTAENSVLKPTVQSLVSSVIENTTQKLNRSITQAQLQSAMTTTISDETRTSLLRSLSSWAEKSHAELRDQLDTAFASAHWRRLKWYKLFWRVDDVSMISSEILERRWLVESEKSLIFLAGRVAGAGILGTPDKDVDAAEITAWLRKRNEPSVKKDEVGFMSPRLIELYKPEEDANDEGGLAPVGEMVPWPMHISVARTHLVKETVPSLQALSQKLVLQTLSTTSLTAAISALAYVSVTSTSVFEAGAVAAFGFVFSLKRMQSKWETAREYWEKEVREEGRKALKETEEGVKVVISEGGKTVIDQEGDEDRELAKKAVERVKEALSRLA